MKSTENSVAITTGLSLFLLFSLLIGCSTGGSTSSSPGGNTSTAASVSRVEMQNGVPTLVINDHAVAPTSLFVYNVELTVAYNSANWLDTFKGYVDKAKSTGVTYLSFELYFHSSMFTTTTQPSVIGSDLNLAKMDALFDYAQQQGIYLLPTIWVSNPPEWWAAQHQEDLQLGYDQTTPPTSMTAIAASFNNPDYWSVMDLYLQAVVARYKSHPALLGWSPCIGMTRENNYGPSYLADPQNPPQSWADYSTYAKNQFRSWLTGKYATDSALRSAWSDTLVTLASATPPMPQESVTNAADIANGAGDTRRQMRDWLDFRLDEKGADWKHFVDFVKSLDPNHIIAMNPADPLFASIGASTKNGAVDGLKRTRDANVDMIIFHPRISYNETEGAYNTQSYTLFAFASYARRLGKIGTFSLEDTGDTVYGGNIESYDRIASIAPMLSSAGGGMGWVVESSSPTLPAWSDAELAKVAEYTYLYEPANRIVNVPEIAILLDPMNEQREYTLGGSFGANSRSKDRQAFYRNLFNAGVWIDPIEIAEVSADPHVLDGYKGVIIANMAGLSESNAQILHDYAASGKGLLVAGRTGIFDSDGNQDYAALKTLLGISELPTSDTTSYATWSFDASTDLLLSGISGQTADTENLYYVPIADWLGNGYAELGHASSGIPPATLLKKGKTVVWFPRLDLTNDDLVVSLINNWLAGL